MVNVVLPRDWLNPHVTLGGGERQRFTMETECFFILHPGRQQNSMKPNEGAGKDRPGPCSCTQSTLWTHWPLGAHLLITSRAGDLPRHVAVLRFRGNMIYLCDS